MDEGDVRLPPGDIMGARNSFRALLRCSGERHVCDVVPRFQVQNGSSESIPSVRTLDRAGGLMHMPGGGLRAADRLQPTGYWISCEAHFGGDCYSRIDASRGTPASTMTSFLSAFNSRLRKRWAFHQGETSYGDSRCCASEA
jgi:hypothetical protein